MESLADGVGHPIVVEGSGVVVACSPETESVLMLKLKPLARQ